MTRISAVIWDAMGWCPMHAAPPFPLQESGSDAGKAIDADGGPVARRSARYMRLAWGVVILSWIVAILALPYLPELIPVHWNMYGVADGFAGRFAGAFGMPAILTGIMVLLLVLPRYDTVQFSLAAFRDIYAMVILATVSMLFCIEVMSLASAFGADLPVSAILATLMGLLFIVMGSLMPHIGRNTAMGIRLPWTLASEEVWKKTHDYAGPLFTGAGILVVIGSLVAGVWALPVMLVIILGVTLYISAWSYRLARHCPKDG